MSMLAPALLLVAQASGSDALVVAPGESVQAMVDRAPTGATIVVSGRHAEAVKVSRPVRLVGASGATLVAPDAPVLQVTGADNVTLESLALRVEGVRASSGFGALQLADSIVQARSLRIEGVANGVVVSGGLFVARDLAVDRCTSAGVVFSQGAAGEVADSRITGCQLGVWITDDAHPKLGHCKLDANRLGVLIAGQARPTVERCAIERSKGRAIAVTGAAEPRLLANTLVRGGEEGIAFLERARGEVRENRIQDHATGVLVSDDAAPQLVHNVLDHNRQAGIVYRYGQGGGTVEDNLLHANGAFGLQLSGPATPRIRHNTVVGHVRCGIHVYNEAAPQLLENLVSGNAVGISNRVDTAGGTYVGGHPGLPRLDGNVAAANVTADLALAERTASRASADGPVNFAPGGWYMLASGGPAAGWSGPPTGAAPLLPTPALAHRPQASPARPPAKPAEPVTPRWIDLKSIHVIGEEFEEEFCAAIEARGSADIPGKFLSRAFAELATLDPGEAQLKRARDYWKRAQREGEADAFGPAYHALDLFLRKNGS